MEVGRMPFAIGNLSLMLEYERERAEPDVNATDSFTITEVTVPIMPGEHLDLTEVIVELGAMPALERLAWNHLSRMR